MGGVRTPMIARNTTIPSSKAEVFSTAADNQPSVEIHVLQGEREMAADNKSLGRFILDGIAPAHRGIPQIEVTFDIDANGVLKVKAKDKGTGKEQHITIQGSTGLTDDEVDKLVKEAEAKKEEDTKRKSLVEAKNMAESTVYQTEKLLVDNKDKINEADTKEVNEKLEAVKAVIANANATKEDYDTAMKPLNEVMMKVGEQIYKQPEAASAAGAAPAQEAPKGDDGVVEGEVEK